MSGKTPVFLLWGLFAGISIISCKKHDLPSSSKSITSFVFQKVDNAALLSADVQGTIRTDTILLLLPPGTALSNLIPTITFTGHSISPASKAARDFTHPVTYTCTAADGSSKTYTVIARPLSTDKVITSFIFRAADNPGLSSDVAGTIGKDTIRVLLSGNATTSALIPTISYNGKSIFPLSGSAQDFFLPVTYTVGAEDGSNHVYTVIVSVNLTLYVGSDDGYLYALDATTGQLKWRTATGGAIRSSPTFYKGLIYVGSGDGSLYAFDSADGSVKWKYSLVSNPSTYTPGAINSSPVVSGGLVYVTLKETYIVALDAISGNLVWQYNIGLATPAGDAGPTVANGVLYAGLFEGDHNLDALDALSGGFKWGYSMGSVHSNPAVVNGGVYSSDDNTILRALDAGSGALRWEYRDSIFNNYGATSGPTVYHGKIYAGGGYGYLYAVDSATGLLSWKYESLGLKNNGSQNNGGPVGIFSSPVGGDGIIYAGNNDGTLYALDASSGTLKWQFGSGATSDITNPTLANGILYSGFYDGNVYALNAKTGVVKWKFQTNGGVYSGPCVLDLKGNTFHAGISGEQN